MYAVASDGLTGVPNAVALTHIHNYDTDLRLFSNGYIELSLLKNLKLKSTIGADIREYRGEYFRPATIPNNGNVAPLPSTERKATEKSTEVINWLNENTITYFRSWGKHDSTLLPVSLHRKTSTATQRLRVPISRMIKYRHSTMQQ